MYVGCEVLDGCHEGVSCKYLEVPKRGGARYMHWLGGSGAWRESKVRSCQLWTFTGVNS